MNIIAPFCPLPHYPAREMAGMQRTIRVMQKSEGEKNIVEVLFAHIAARLGCSIESNHTVRVLYKDHDDEHVAVIMFGCITDFDIRNAYIIFLFDGKTFKLSLFGKTPSLTEKVSEDGWVERTLL